MIEVIANGFDKEFYQECFVCRSLLKYCLTDLSEYEGEKYLKCPVCNNKLTPSYNTIMPSFEYYPYVAPYNQNTNRWKYYEVTCSDDKD